MGHIPNIKNCIILRECRRFEEPLLEELLDTIRKPTAGERRVRNELWEQLEKCYAGADEYMDTDGVDRRFKQAEFLDAVFMSQSWALVAREQQHRIERNAQRRGELVYYIQAVDTCRHHLVRDEYMRALQLQNMTKTARMMGLLGCFKGMRARVTKRINPADAIVQDTPVTVLSVAFDPEEETPWIDDPEHPAWIRGWVRLRFLPKAVYVLLDDHRPGVCDACRGTVCKCARKVCDKACEAVCPHRPGTVFAEGEDPGVLAITPFEDATDSIRLAGDTRTAVTLNRRQIPLAPLEPGTVQSFQGGNADYAICNLGGSEGALKFTTEQAREVYWRHVYVELSRCRRIENLLLLNPPDNFRDILEAGPPQFVLDEMEELYALEWATIGRAREALVRLGWQDDDTLYPDQAHQAENRERSRRTAGGRVGRSVRTAPTRRDKSTAAAEDGAARTERHKIQGLGRRARGSTSATRSGTPVDANPQMLGQPPATAAVRFAKLAKDTKAQLWDFLPSGAAVEVARSLDRTGHLAPGSLFEHLQTSTECGYIAAKIIAALADRLEVLDGVSHFPPLTEQEARELAIEAVEQVPQANEALARLTTSTIHA